MPGAPRLKMDMGPAHCREKRASYKSGNGMGSLTLAHQAVELNTSTQGIAVLANTRELSGLVIVCRP